MCYEICNDGRNEIIERAKQDLLESTNIDTSPEEMKVLNDFLHRCWQMGWLDMYERRSDLEQKIDFICEQLAKDFDEPCNFSPIDEIMLSIGRCGEDCGNVPKSECWRRYFEEMQRRSEQ